MNDYALVATALGIGIPTLLLFIRGSKIICKYFYEPRPEKKALVITLYVLAYFVGVGLAAIGFINVVGYAGFFVGIFGGHRKVKNERPPEWVEGEAK